VWIDDISLTASPAVEAEQTSQAERTQLHVFMQDHCAACHDAASATAKLVTESLPDDFTDPRWVRIHDRVAAGEMPPARTMERPDFSGHSSLSAAARRCSPGLAIPAIPTRMAPSRRSSRVCRS